MDPLATIVGAVVGVLVGLTATGGGALLTPALVLGLGVPPSVAIGSDVLIASVMKLAAGGAYAARRAVHWSTVRRLAAGSVPGALLGAALVGLLPDPWRDAVLVRAIGVAVTLAGFATLWRLLRPAAAAPTRTPGPVSTALLGLAIGVLVGATSVGSGSVLMAVLVTAWPLPAATLVGTDLIHALLLSSAATLGHLAGGRVDFGLAATVLVGGLPGAWLGARLAASVPERALRGGLAAVLVIAGTTLAIGGTSRAARAATPTMSTSTAIDGKGRP